MRGVGISKWVPMGLVLALTTLANVAALAVWREDFIVHWWWLAPLWALTQLLIGVIVGMVLGAGHD